MPTEFEWKIFLGTTALGFLEKIQKYSVNFEHLKGKIIFKSMFNDIVRDAKGNEAQCEHNSQAVAEYARKFPRGHWSPLGSGSEEKWYGTLH